MSSHPGVQVVEKDDFPAIQNPGAAFSGMVLRTKRGRDDVVTFLTNLDQFETRYGGPSSSNPYGWESARDYFEEGGTGLYVIRVVGAGADAAELFIDPANDSGAADAASSIQLLASSDGVWADSSVVSTAKVITAVATTMGAVGAVVELASVAGLESGDVVTLDLGGANEEVGIITSVNTSTNEITLRTATGTAFAAGVTVASATQHKYRSSLAAPLDDGTGGAPTQITVASTAALDVGALLLIISAANDRVLEVRVDEIIGTTLKVTTTENDDGVALPAGSRIVSVNFNVIHTVDGTTTVHSNMTLESADANNYAVNVLAQSEYLRAAIPGSAPASGAYAGGTFRSVVYPLAISNIFMDGGLDGAAPSNDDYKGTNSAKAYAHGLKLFDNVDVLPQFGIPAASVNVQQAMAAYAENRGDTAAVGEAPLAADTLAELLDYRNVTLNVASSYMGLYAPWLIEEDSLTPGATVSVPPTGKVLGTYSEVATRRGTQKPPANEPLTGVQALTASFDDESFGLLNDAGVNLIRSVSGRGIRVMGARTLWPNADRKRFMNVRRILNSIKIGLRNFGVDLVQEANDDVLWRKIQQEGEKYLEQRWQEGWLFPRGNPEEAYFFVCDATTNTEALRQDATVRAVAGVNPVLPGEIIKFEVALFDGGAVNVNEL